MLTPVGCPVADLKLMLRQLRSPGGCVSVIPEGIAGAAPLAARAIGCWQMRPVQNWRLRHAGVKVTPKGKTPVA